MTTKQQKDRERGQLIKALNLLEMKDYKIVEDKESPDFLIKVEDKIVGVEVVENFRDFGDGNAAETQSNLSRLIEKATGIYDQKKGIPFSFIFGFNGRVVVKGLSSISRDLADFLLDQTNKLPSGQLNCSHKINVENANIPALKMIIAQRRDFGESSVGVLFSAFDSKQLHCDDLKSVMQKKSKLLQTYKKRCESIWLLIVLPKMTLAADFVFPDNGFLTKNGGFDAIYVLDEYRSEIRLVSQG
jgi:hypothetical protein